MGGYEIRGESEHARERILNKYHGGNVYCTIFATQKFIVMINTRQEKALTHALAAMPKEFTTNHFNRHLDSILGGDKRPEYNHQIGWMTQHATKRYGEGAARSQTWIKKGSDTFGQDMVNAVNLSEERCIEFLKSLGCYRIIKITEVEV